MKALALPWAYAVARPLLVGHPGVVARALAACASAGTLARPLAVREVSGPEAARFELGTLDVWSPEPCDDAELAAHVGRVCIESGRVSVAWVKAAARAALAGRVHAVVTGPLNKEAFNTAGCHFAGHTELLAAETGAATSRLALVHVDPAPILRGEWDARATLCPGEGEAGALAAHIGTSGSLNVVHATAHIALRDVSKALTRERLLTTIRMAHAFCVDMGVPRPRVAVTGLNPHAGDGGLFGDEEAAVIAPCVAEAVAEGLQVTGPWPGDTVFLHAVKGRFDVVVRGARKAPPHPMLFRSSPFSPAFFFGAERALLPFTRAPTPLTPRRLPRFTTWATYR